MAKQADKPVIAIEPKHPDPLIDALADLLLYLDRRESTQADARAQAEPEEEPTP